MSEQLTTRLSGRLRLLPQAAADVPLVVAIHGGTYTSAYFDLPDSSFLDRAAANRIPAIAIDRPGYGGSPALAPERMTIADQASYLVEPLRELWELHGEGRGIVLIGHSIGGAIAATIASTPGDLPVVGLAVSGVGLRTPTHHGPMWASLPDEPFVSMPGEVKDVVMFGPAGSYAASAPEASRGADAPTPKAELIAITGVWQQDAARVLSAIRVPVHYRQAEHDALWIVSQEEVDGFAAALSASPRVDAALVRGTGHCIDLHHVAAAFQLQQLGFALQCGIEADAANRAG